jgi:hypothetical protein
LQAYFCNTLVLHTFWEKRDRNTLQMCILMH